MNFYNCIFCMTIHFELCTVIREKCRLNRSAQACICGPIFWLVNPEYATAEDLVNNRAGLEVLLLIIHNSTSKNVEDTLMVRKEYAISYITSALQGAI